MLTYRSDVIGSLLRPDYLKEARTRREAGTIDDWTLSPAALSSLEGGML
jgi:methionine synthase II (cobalamin-independent)